MPPDLKVILDLLQIGVGGFLAGVVIVFYVRRERDLRERQEKREEVLVEVLQQNTSASERQAATAAKLAESIDRMGESLKRAEIERAREMATLIASLKGGT